MNVREYVPVGYNVDSLARAHETDLGRIIIHAIKVEQARVRKLYRKKPKVNCEDVTDDIRYMLGRESAVGFIADLFRAARDDKAGAPAEPRDFTDEDVEA